MLASNPAAILDQIFGRAGIALTQESTQDDHALSPRKPSLASEQQAGRDQFALRLS
jgi:hypothetical protein